MGDRITSGQWIPSGNDFVIDGLWGRLGFQETVGETRISGATNGLASVEDPANGNTYVYAGAANGGLYLRSYNKAKGKWAKSWKWLTEPGSSYTGSQGIGIIEPSPDGGFIAVGQGNPSNYFAASAPSRGVQIGRIEPGGAVSWLPFSDDFSSRLNGLDVRSLVWQGNLLRGTAWDTNLRIGRSFTIATENGAVVDVSVGDESSLNLVADGGNGFFLTAGFDANTFLNQVSINGSLLQGDQYQELLASFASDSAREPIARISAFPELVDGKVIAFLGTFLVSSLNEFAGKNPILRIIRLEIDPASGELISYQSTNPSPSFFNDVADLYLPFGSNQAENIDNYGNFSFEADPYDPDAQSIFVGGNQYFLSPLSPSTLFTGGLVSVDFRAADPTLTPLYGPRIKRTRSEAESGPINQKQVLDGNLVLPFNPGAPHADSRSIAFYNSREGINLLQTDDGGVWELPQRSKATGLATSPKTWWSSLSAPGMATLELTQVDWNSANNLIISSYQDNASSTGIYGEPYASNIGVGDGQLALFDDANPNNVRAYVASQRYYQNGSIRAVNYDKNGFVKSITYPQFYLQDSENDRLVPWSKTAEASQLPGDFILPVETNAYRSGSLVQTGYANVYEQTESGQFGDVAVVFRPLLPESSSRQLTPTALDAQSPVTRETVQSLYVGAVLPDKEIALLGRRSGSDPNNYQLRPLEFQNLDSASLTTAGQVVDVTHIPGGSSGDTVFWLQGGQGLAYGLNVRSVPASQQVLRFGREGEPVTTLTLDALGLPLVPDDRFGYQALQYVPQTDSHPALLLIAGLNGVWSSELSADGVPLGFSPMPWQALPDSGPGAYIRSLSYDPTDDLLIAASQGKGSYLYSFSGEIGDRSTAKRALHLSDLTLPLLSEPVIDKRGNEINALISIQLDARRLDRRKPAELEIKLHDVSAWRRAMEFVSPYNLNVSPGYKAFTNATAQAFRVNNILDPIGLRYQGGEQRSGDISFPIEIAAGATLFNLQVNPKDRPILRAIDPLKYTVRLSGSKERLTRELSFEFPPLANTTQPLDARALQTPDVITGLGDGKSSMFSKALQVADLSDPVDTSASMDRAPTEACDGVRALCFATPSALREPGLLEPRSIPMLMNDSNLFVQNSPLL